MQELEYHTAVLAIAAKEGELPLQLFTSGDAAVGMAVQTLRAAPAGPEGQEQAGRSAADATLAAREAALVQELADVRAEQHKIAERSRRAAPAREVEQQLMEDGAAETTLAVVEHGAGRSKPPAERTRY